MKTSENMEECHWNDFAKIDIRTGTILKAHFFKEARKPAYVLEIDFGAVGVKKSSAQITDHYQAEDLIGKQILAVINLPPKQISTIRSQCLVLGVIQKDGKVVLVQPQQAVENGLKIS